MRFTSFTASYGADGSLALRPAPRALLRLAHGGERAPPATHGARHAPLDQESASLTLRRNALFQEDIIEEIEVLLIGTEV